MNYCDENFLREFFLLKNTPVIGAGMLLLEKINNQSRGDNNENYFHADTYVVGGLMV